MKTKMKAILSLFAAVMMLGTCVGASACTAIYVGADLTADGTTLFARSEDIANSYNKLAFVSPAGAHKAGEEYVGCYGYVGTFTKDTYSYTAFSDDNGLGECPDCGGTHAHTPYQAGGTNEKGVSMSATETIGCSDAIFGVDPYVETGVEEAEVTTMVLGQAETAREGVEILLGIYDAAGCAGGSGIFIADANETWYIENASGTQYVAIKLSSSMVMAEPNMTVIGLVDLDDTDNVIASAKLVETAKNAGTFVGDEEANTINYMASYNGDETANSRMVNALSYFNTEKASAEPTADAYAISNVDTEGNVVPMYTNITLDHAWTVADVVGYYHIPGIGSSRNLETHIFAVTPGDASVTGTVEWIAMDNASKSVFVPYYPMLTTKMNDTYSVSTEPATFTEEKPADAAVVYATTKNKRDAEGNRVAVAGFTALPADWASSMYWACDALSNLMEFGELSEEQVAVCDEALTAMQNDCYEAFESMKTAVAAAETTEAAAELATAGSDAAAAMVQAGVVELVNNLTK